MSAEDPQPPPEPRDTPGRRAFLLWSAVALLVLGTVAAAGWFILDRWQASRAADRDARVVGALHHKLAVEHQPLADDETATLLALCDAADAETRFTALSTAAADAVRHHPDRKPRVVPVAARLAGDREAKVREKAIRALAGLRAREHVELIRPSLSAADPKERAAAEEALKVLEAAGPPK